MFDYDQWLLQGIGGPEDDSDEELAELDRQAKEAHDEFMENMRETLDFYR